MFIRGKNRDPWQSLIDRWLAFALTHYASVVPNGAKEAGNLPTLRSLGGKVGSRGSTGRDIFGDVALLVFLLAQASDGVLTYVGVSTYGLHIEANPLIGWLMTLLGEGAALAAAKGAAVGFGIALHLSSVHRAVAALAVLYLAVAVFPWITILFYY